MKKESKNQRHGNEIFPDGRVNTYTNTHTCTHTHPPKGGPLGRTVKFLQQSFESEGLGPTWPPHLLMCECMQEL